MNLIKRSSVLRSIFGLVLGFIYLGSTSNAHASICQTFLLGDEHGLTRAWQEFLLTDSEGELSLNRKVFIENYFVDILVTNFIKNHRPDLLDQRDKAMDLIDSDIESLKEYIRFKQMLIYGKFEELKKLIDHNPEGYRSELSMLKANIESLTDLISKNLVY